MWRSICILPPLQFYSTVRYNPTALPITILQRHSLQFYRLGLALPVTVDRDGETRTVEVELGTYE